MFTGDPQHAAPGCARPQHQIERLHGTISQRALSKRITGKAQGCGIWCQAMRRCDGVIPGVQLNAAASQHRKPTLNTIKL